MRAASASRCASTWRTYLAALARCHILRRYDARSAFTTGGTARAGGASARCSAGAVRMRRVAHMRAARAAATPHAATMKISSPAAMDISCRC